MWIWGVILIPFEKTWPVPECTVWILCPLRKNANLPMCRAANATHKSIPPNWFTAHTLNVERGGRSWREEIPGGRRLWWVLSTPFLVYLNLNLGISLLTLSPIDGDISFTMTSSGHFFSKWVNYRERVNSGGHFLVNSSGHFLTVITNSADTVGQPMQGMRGQSPW